MARRAKVATVARRGDSVATLRRLRDQLAEELDAQRVEHIEGCECACGQLAADARQVVALARALADVLAQLDARGAVPDAAPVSVDDELRRRRNARRAG